jgi:transposase
MDDNAMQALPSDPRAQRGAALAQSKASLIRPLVDSKFLVPSATHPGASYVVDLDAGSCSCPDYAENGPTGVAAGLPFRCKHVTAVLIVRREIALPDGNSVIVEDKIQFKVPRDWAVTNESLVDLHRLAPPIIHSLVQGIPLRAGPRGRGRPASETRDVVHAAILQTLNHRTYRGAVELVDQVRTAGLWGDRGPMHYNTLNEHANDPALLPVFKDLVFESAKPLVDVATNFSIDSTGFTTHSLENWRRFRYGSSEQKQEGRKHKWVKGHFCIDNDFGIITGIAITDRRVGDAPMLDEVIHQVVRNGFHIHHFCADAGYISTENAEIVENLGGVPFIKFRKNMTGRSSAALTRLAARINADPEAWKDSYNQRANVESAIGVMKTMWGGNVAARKEPGMYMRVAAKAICHNVSRLIRVIHLLGIEPKFWEEYAPTPARTIVQVPSGVPLHIMGTTQ